MSNPITEAELTLEQLQALTPEESSSIRAVDQRPVTDAELVEMFKFEVDRWHCGCNAGGMCGCYIDRDTGMVHRRDKEPAHGQMMRLIAEVRRLRELSEAWRGAAHTDCNCRLGACRACAFISKAEKLEGE